MIRKSNNLKQNKKSRQTFFIFAELYYENKQIDSAL